MNVIKIISLLLWAFMGGTWVGLSLAVADGRLSGNILNEKGHILKNFAILVNDAESFTGKDGTYSVPGTYGDRISLQVTAKGYYTIRHSFAMQELDEGPRGEKIIPAITLVAKKQGRVMLAFGGDVMMARRYKKPRAGEEILIRDEHKSHDTKEIVKYIKPYFEVADFGSVNLETQVMAHKPKGSSTKSITFFSSPETVDALAWAGVDYVTLGNNHTYDNLREGLVATLDILKDSSLGFSGAGLNEEQALQAYRTSISGVAYSFMGYVGWRGSSIPHQAAEGPDKGGAALGTMANIITSVDREVKTGHTTVVQYHGSLEYSEEPTLVTEQKLKSAIDEGADIAIAHHPHVVQGFEIYKDRLIAYSLGNFIFDQYYYGPQFSYMLYVWMDGEKFHRAGIVPLYIKGYKPTPAVGIIRTAVLKRVASLSARRNISLGYSGGHGVITRNDPVAPQKINQIITLKGKGEKILSMDHCGPSDFITGLYSENANIQYRLGQELLRRGDFEHYDSFEAPERGWLPQNEGSGAISFQGGKVFKVIPDAGQDKSIFGMKVFTRIYKAGNPMSFSGKIYGMAPGKLDFYLQLRPSRWGLKKSLTSGPKKYLGSVSIIAGGWQDFTINFNTPRVGVHSLRILVEASGIEGQQVAPVYYDNVNLIQWQTAYENSGTGGQIASPNRITHMGIRGAEKSSDKLELHLLNYANTSKKCRIE